jgi:hypothetical protein
LYRRLGGPHIFIYYYKTLIKIRAFLRIKLVPLSAGLTDKIGRAIRASYTMEGGGMLSAFRTVSIKSLGRKVSGHMARVKASKAYKDAEVYLYKFLTLAPD